MITLPRPYISYSAASLWFQSKSAYRSRYYFDAPPLSSVQMEFGKEVADILKSDPEHPSVANVIKYPIRDEGFTVSINEINVLMYPDTLSLDGIPSFREYKSSEWIEGKPSWTAEKVDAHMQLKLYSLGIMKKYGDVQDLCHLDWLVTKMVDEINQIKINGKQYDVAMPIPKLTGEVITFPCVVNDLERFRAAQWITQAAHEIANDFANYKNNL